MINGKSVLTLRIDPDIYETIKNIADREKRSINSQIEFALEKYAELYNEQNKIKINVNPTEKP